MDVIIQLFHKINSISVASIDPNTLTSIGEKEIGFIFDKNSIQ